MQALHAYEHKGRALNLTEFEGEGMAPRAAGGQPGHGVREAGGGAFEFGDLRVDWDGQALTVSGQMGGRNLAYLYTELLLKDPEADRYYGPVLRDYVRTKAHDGTSGITRPVWGDQVELRAVIRPLLRLVTDGAHFAFCFAFPESYSSPDYRQSGLYTPAGETDPLRALLGFSGDGSLKRAIAYAGQNGRFGSRVLTPEHGDRFVPLAQVLTPSAAGGWAITSAEADPLTLGSWPLRVVTESALPGDYLVGVLAQDLDGGLYRKYVPAHCGA